jgi:hypothetical protein
MKLAKNSCSPISSTLQNMWVLEAPQVFVEQESEFL